MEEKIYKQKVILVIICFIILIVISIKGLFLHWFSPFNSIKIPEYKHLTIEHQDAEEYLEAGHFKIRNDFGEYQLVSNDPTKTDIIESEERTSSDSVLYDRDDGLSIRKLDTNNEYDDIYVSNSIEYYTLKMFGISNNYEFHKYLSNKKDLENHLYTPIITMLRNKYLQEELNKDLNIERIDLIYLFDGANKGYYYEVNGGQYRTFCIYNEKKIYAMTFNGSKTTREQVFDLLSTVIIN